VNLKLSRVWVALAFTLLFTVMIGVVAVGLLTAADNQRSPVELTSTPVAQGPCAFVWARQALLEVAEQARKVLDDARLSNVEVRFVEAYGENCLEADGQTVRYFAAMTTDFYLSATVSNLDDEDLGQIVENSYRALITIPRDDLPARHGYLDFIFTSGQQEKRLRVMFDQVKAALDEGQHGAALWAALGQ
jgi:hypothetical protein